MYCQLLKVVKHIKWTLTHWKTNPHRVSVQLYVGIYICMMLAVNGVQVGLP